jgi:hypothetical protein
MLHLKFVCTSRPNTYNISDHSLKKDLFLQIVEKFLPTAEISTSDKKHSIGDGRFVPFVYEYVNRVLQYEYENWISFNMGIFIMTKLTEFHFVSKISTYYTT